MKLTLTTAWTKLNDKLTNKFGAFVRHGSNVEITFETTPVASTQGKVYSLYQTINVDPAIEMYARSMGKESILTLDENFYEEEGSSSSPEIVNCYFKLTKYTENSNDWNLLEIYDLSNNLITVDKSKRYVGLLTDKEEGSYGFNIIQLLLDDLSITTVRAQGASDISGLPITPVVPFDSVQIDQQIELYYSIGKNTFFMTPTSYITQFSESSVAPQILTTMTKDMITKDMEIYQNNLNLKDTTIDLAPSIGNSTILSYLTNSFRAKNFTSFKNLNFTSNFDASAYIGAIEYEMSVDSSVVTPIQYQVKVSLIFDELVNGVSRLERYFKVNKSAYFYEFDNSEIFYTFSKWKLIRPLEKQLIEVQFKIESAEIGVDTVPVLNLYDLDNNKLQYESTKKYYGKLTSKEAFGDIGLPTRIYFENGYYYVEVQSIFNGNVSTSNLPQEALNINQIITLDYFKLDDSIILTPDSFNIQDPNISTSIIGSFSKSHISTMLDEYTYNHSRVPYTFNALNSLSNTTLLTQLLQQWNRNAFCLIRNLKFTNYDFAGASGNIYGNMYFKLKRASADIPLEFYTLNVRIEFSPPSSGISSLERDFSLTKNATTGIFTISTSEVFYDESKWKFNRDTYYAPVTNLINTFPIAGWVDWVNIDPKATNLIIVLEHVENLRATFDVSLRSLSIVQDYQYNLNAGTTWNVIRLHGTKIQISSPTNGASGNKVKLINAFFYK